MPQKSERHLFGIHAKSTVCPPIRNPRSCFNAIEFDARQRAIVKQLCTGDCREELSF